jgi:hypothetical protein
MAVLAFAPLADATVLESTPSLPRDPEGHGGPSDVVG